MVAPAHELSTLLDPGSKLEQRTRMCLQDLHNADQIICKDLLCVVDEHSLACEGLAGHWELRTARLRALLQACREEIRFSRPRLGSGDGTTSSCLLPQGGLLGELFSSGDVPAFFSLGLAPGDPLPLAPAMCRTAEQGARPERTDSDADHEAEDIAAWPPRDEDRGIMSSSFFAAKACRADFSAASDGLGCGLDKLFREGARLLPELESLGSRLEKLRACWPCLRQRICRAYDAGEPLDARSLAWTLNEVLSWRRALAAAFVQADVVGHLLQDGISRGRERHEEGFRWRSMSQELLAGMGRAVSARAAAVLWLHGRLVDPEEAASALEWNLERAGELKHRLVKCAGMVMRVEPEHAVVQQAVRRLSALKTDLHARAEEVTHARRTISNPDVCTPCGDLVGLVCEVLRKLLRAVDHVAAVLDGSDCSGDSPAEAITGDVAVFRGWIRLVLLRPGGVQVADQSADL